MELRVKDEDRETVRGINRVNDALVRFFTSSPVKFAVLTALVVAGTAPKRWHSI